MDTLIEFARKLTFLNLPVPRSLRLRGFRWLIDLRFARFMKKRFGLYYKEETNYFTPPKELFIKVGAATPQEFDQATASRRDFDDAYYSLGRYTVLRFLQEIERQGGNVRTIGSVFELGCGTGRLTQHLRCIEGLEVIASDLNPEMVAWCRERLDGVAVYKNDVVPPLGFLEDQSVDLVFCYSVFTHIPLQSQTAWLTELHRVLRPGGFLICTLAGWRLQKQFVRAEDVEKLRARGHVEYTSSDANASLSTKVGGSGWDVYQTRSEVVRVFGEIFTIRDYLTIGQDTLVLQKERQPAPALPEGLRIDAHRQPSGRSSATASVRSAS